MSSRQMKRRLTAAIVATLAGAMISAAPAAADCLYAEAWVEVASLPRQYVIGPKRCVAQTPFPQTFETGVEREVGVVAGVSAGAGARVWVPAP